MTDTILGIDLGTTNSEVAMYVNGTVTVIEGADGKLVPSYVGLDDKDNLLVGKAARNQYVLYPERTIKSIKRLMGQSEPVAMGEKSYSPQEISAMILRNLKQIAENHIGQTVTKAVITVPAYFSDKQRQATREAGEIAGLEVVKMINEPTAATLVYESNHTGSKKVLVYDLGGGTFDVSLVELQDDVIEVIASHGNNLLGGDDFDELIEQWLTAELHGKGISEIPPQAMARLRRASETAKIQLSNQPFSMIEEEYLMEHKGAPFNLSIELARSDYEEMITPLIDQTLDAIHVVLKDAGLTASEVDEILLVGGSARTPLVQERLEQEFGMAPRFEIDPDLCVAAGAAMQAAMIGGMQVRAVLVDITPYTFGTSAIGELDGDFTLDLYVPVIKKNTPIPVTRSEVFYTSVDNQKHVKIMVYQGEAPHALDNLEVGSFFVEGLGEYPEGSEIIATFALNTDGILQVSATEKATGLNKSVTIQNVLSETPNETLAEAREKIHQLFTDETMEETPASDSIEETGEPESSGAITNSRRIQAEALVEKANSILQEACEEDRDDITVLIENIKSALADDEASLLEESMEELSEIIFFMET